MKYKITHTTNYNYSVAVPVCHNLVHLVPRTTFRQKCEKFRLLVNPQPNDMIGRGDYFGNRASYFSIDQAHHTLTVTASSRVTVNPVPDVDPDQTPGWESLVKQLQTCATGELLEAYEFAVASPIVEPFPALTDYARQSFPASRPVLAGLLDLTARIHCDFRYDPQSTTVHTPIHEVFENQHGVCQDFAHLQIGCLRGLGLAARYVSGYLRTLPPPGEQRLVGADASHAWLSVYCGDAGWVDVDPTNNLRISTDHITVAWGRDYNDVCPIKGVIVGGGDHRMSVSVDVAPANAA